MPDCFSDIRHPVKLWSLRLLYLVDIYDFYDIIRRVRLCDATFAEGNTPSGARMVCTVVLHVARTRRNQAIGGHGLSKSKLVKGV